MAFVRYALAGGLATAVHYLMLVLLVEALRQPAAPSAAFGALCGAAIAYLGNRCLTFAGTAVTHRVALPRFVLVAAATAALSGVVVAGGVLLGAHYLAAQALATGIGLGVGYRLNKTWTFA